MNTESFKSRFQFVNHGITELRVYNNILNFIDDDSYIKTIDVDYKIQEINKIEDEYVGILVLNTNIMVECQNDTENKFSLYISMFGVFTGSSNADQNDFEKYMNISGTSTLYSITRSIVIDLSAKSFANGQIRIPMLNVHAMHEAKIKQKQED